MSYNGSKDYLQLVKLLQDGHSIIVFNDFCYWASYDKWKGYYIGSSWLEHDIELSVFADKNADAFVEFCNQNRLEFIDPNDYNRKIFI